MKVKLFPLMIALFALSVISATSSEVEVNPASTPNSSGINAMWLVSKSVSPIDDSQTIVMTLLPFKNSGREGALIIRWVERKLEVIVRGGGYIGIDSPKVTLRWDSGRAETEVWSSSTMGDAAFARKPRAFIQRAMKASRLVVRVHEFRADVTAEYDLTGLNAELNKLPDLKKVIVGK